MKIFLTILFLTTAFQSYSQGTIHVDKKTKEFIVPPNIKTDYNIIGYQFPNLETRKMICFSGSTSIVVENNHDCPLGAYFDTNHLKLGDMVLYLGTVGSFAKMNFIQGTGKKTIIYIPKSSFVIK